LSGVSLNATALATLIAVALASIILLAGAASVVASAFAGSIHEDQPKDVLDRLVGEHQTTIKQYQERFKNRYVFFKPPPAYKPPPPPPVDDTPPPPPVDTTPKTSVTYQGPSIAWVIGDDVYFNLNPPTQTEKYLRVKVGEERSGVKVLNLDKMPRTVRVAHGGGEYDVKVFGDSSLSSALFPTTPRPSVLTPGLIPSDAPATVAPTVADSGEVEEPDADAEGEAELETQAAVSGDAPQPGEDRGRGQGESPRGDGRRRPRESGGERPTRPDEEAPRPPAEQPGPR
jgi:hypothetical protein